jgi:maltooligosyltrehalose trehalohydrolase
VRAGRARFLAQFPSYATEAVQQALADPGAAETFERCKLDFSERATHASVYALHEDLLRLRHSDPAFNGEGRRGIDGAILDDPAFVLRYFSTGGDRLLIVNLGPTLTSVIVSEPLLAPPAGTTWRTLWSSEAPRYGGSGAAAVELEDGGWCFPGQAAVVLAPLKSARHA